MTAQLSVVIPTYNRAKLVETCVRSILARPLSTEVVVVDDGGTDDTESVVRALGPRAIYVRQANAGPAKARNLGFLSSRAPYVTFLDSDDEWLADGPERLVAQLDRHHELDIAFADTSMGSRESGFESFVAVYGGALFGELPGTYLEPGLKQLSRWPFLRQLSRRNVMFLGSLVVRRDAFVRAGEFDVTLRGAADWNWFMRASARCTVAFSEGPATSLYFKHDDGMSTDSTHMHEDFMAALAAVWRTCDLPRDVRSHIRSEWRRHAFDWGYRAYDDGQFALARRRWKAALTGPGFSARTFGYLTATFLPQALVHRARTIKRHLAA